MVISVKLISRSPVPRGQFESHQRHVPMGRRHLKAAATHAATKAAVRQLLLIPIPFLLPSPRIILGLLPTSCAPSAPHSLLFHICVCSPKSSALKKHIELDAGPVSSYSSQQRKCHSARKEGLQGNSLKMLSHHSGAVFHSYWSGVSASPMTEEMLSHLHGGVMKAFEVTS
jgi:hypothetical protein